MTIEIWKDIPGFESVYQASDFGRIKSLSRAWVCGNRGTIRKKAETIMRLSVDGRGYCQVELCLDGKHKKYSVHRLIGTTFIKNKDNKPCINHKNSQRTDNRVENLEWCTHSENSIHAFEYGNKKGYKGESHGMCRLTESDVLEIRRLGDTHTQQELSEMFNTGRRNVGHILSRKLWNHI